MNRSVSLHYGNRTLSEAQLGTEAALMDHREKAGWGAKVGEEGLMEDSG